MVTLEDINRQIQQEQDSYHKELNRLQQSILNLKSRHQSNIERLKAEKERIKQQSQQLEDYNKLLDFVMYK